MREIKFRAWDKDQKRMRFDLVRSNMGNIYCWNNYVLGYSTEMNPECFEWMQYTGLHDKNGKEIYEGDFLQAENSDGELGNIKGYVEYDKAKFVVHRYEGHTMAKMGNPLWTFRTSHIVIGNIYEHPNLFTNEK